MRQRPSHRVATTVLVLLATLLTFLSAYAVWLRQQVLDGPAWADTSTELVRDRDVRHAIAVTLADRLAAEPDVRAVIADALDDPARTGTDLRGALEQAIDDELRTPAVQRLWRQASLEAQRELVRVLEGREPAAQVDRGRVVLDLRAVVRRVAADIGVAPSAVALLPPGTARVELLRSRDLVVAQDATRAARVLSVVLPLLTLLAWAAALLLARGRRRAVLLQLAAGLVVAGAAVLLTRTVGGDAIAAAVVEDPADTAAAGRVWAIGTTLLRDIGAVAIAVGVVLAIAAALTGLRRLPGRRDETAMLDELAALERLRASGTIDVTEYDRRRRRLLSAG